MSAGFQSHIVNCNCCAALVGDTVIVDKAVADSLMRCSGKMVELRYKEYNGMLPWRGMQHYIVYEILSVDDGKVSSEIPYVVGGETI